MPLSNLFRNKVLDSLFGAQALSGIPATLYIGLSATAPNADGTGVTEPAGLGYARVAVTNNLANWPAAVLGAKSNANVIQFPEPTASWGTVTHLVVYDAAAVGNLIGYIALAAAKTLLAGSNVVFLAGEIDLTQT